MWANTCWGFLFLAIAAGTPIMTGVSPAYVWVLPWLPWATGFFILCSLACFCWPLLKRSVNRMRGVGNKVAVQQCVEQTVMPIDNELAAKLHEQRANYPDANLSLVWLNNMLQLCIDNHGADAMFEATIDLSNAGVRGVAGRQYAAVWADDPNATAKKIFEGSHGFITLYTHEVYPRNIYAAIFHCQTGGQDRFVKTKYYSEDGPRPHIIDISVSSSPRMMGGAKYGRIEVNGEQIKVVCGDIQGPQ